MTDHTSTASELDMKATTLSNQSELLNKELTARSKRLAKMHLGVFEALNNKVNPDYLAQAAHSARELMEKAPQDLPDVPIAQSSGELKGDVKSLHDVWKLIKESERWKDCPPWAGEIDGDLAAMLSELGDFFEDFVNKNQERSVQATLMVQRLDPAGPTLPKDAISKRIRWWMGVKDRFTCTSHHQPSRRSYNTPEELLADFEELERFLLSLLLPQPVKEFGEIDQLIQEGESK